eukprot:Sspe_Gene.108777::Locus_87907_Transcript_1_1_Confidence_1.000_Length_437::g.108777::m.108777
MRWDRVLLLLCTLVVLLNVPWFLPPPANVPVAPDTDGSPCQAAMAETGGVFGLPPDIFYDQVQAPVQTGYVKRTAPCLWTVDMRDIPVPGSEVRLVNATGPRGETIGVVASVDPLSPPRQEAPDGVVQ